MNEIATLQPVEAEHPLTVQQLTARLKTIQDVMKQVMQKDVDFGVIPGTQKPTLYKPGAEKLCVTFRLSADDPSIEAVPDDVGDIRYRVRVPVRASNGVIVAVGVGECSTGEEKYRWRRPVHIKEFEAANDDQRRVKWQRSGDAWQQVRVNPADVANTVLKMAHKRAYVHAVVMATAAGAIFTQDLEDLPEEVRDAADDGQDQRRPPVQPPQRRSEAAAAGPRPATSTPTPASNGGERKVSEAQANRLFAIARNIGYQPDEYKAWLKREHGLDSDKDILFKDYDRIVKSIQEAAGA